MDLSERPQQSFVRHPWEVTRARFIARVLRDHGVYPGVRSILDVGAGDAWLAGTLAELSPDASIVCWDRFYSDQDLERIGATQHHNLSAVREAPKERFALACALDVLEHVEDDVGFLADITACLEPSGWLLITVPAHQALWTHHDELLDHHRRYSARSLGSLISTAELEVIARGSFFHSLLVPRALAALRERFAPPSAGATQLGHWSAPPLVTRAVLAALRADNAVSRTAARLRFPLPGLSLWALCRMRS